MAEPLIRISLEEPRALSRLRFSLPETLRSHIRSARELSRELEDAAGEGAFRTAVPAFDRLLDGGLPRGQLIELVGSRTSGRFSALLAVLAGATGAGETAALVDLGDGLSPALASRMGVELERLLWARPAQLKEALAATEMLIDGGFPLVALDLGNPPVRGGRGIEAAWLRLARAARAHDAVLLVSTPYRVSGTAAGVVLKANPGHAAWQGGSGSPWLLAGADSRIEIEKHRGRQAGQGEDLRLAAVSAPVPGKEPEKPKLRLLSRREREAAALREAPLLRRVASA